MAIWALIRGWWRRRQRRLDCEILWPQLVRAGPDLRWAQNAFLLHAMTDPAWRELDEVELYRIIGSLTSHEGGRPSGAAD